MSASKAYCNASGGHYPERVLASLPSRLDLDGIGVQCGNTGKAICWGDGTYGLTQEQRNHAEADDEPMCMEHFTGVDWEHKEIE